MPRHSGSGGPNPGDNAEARPPDQERQSLASAPGQSTSTGFPIGPLLGALALSVPGAGLVSGLDRLRRSRRQQGSAARASRGRQVAGQVGRFVLHFAEMTLVMEVGMMA